MRSAGGEQRGRRGPDPRLYQIAVLGALLAWGVARLELEVEPRVAAAILASALAAQLAFTRAFRLPAFEPKSALISGLSLCLLLRTASPWLGAAAGAIAIASKFLVRWQGKHVFNPSNIALVALLAASERVWASPGQWGSGPFFALAVAGAGMFVVQRSARADVTLAFLGAWAALLVARTLWLGDPLSIPVHQLQNGALLVFAFYMISDPRTTPDRREARVVFACAVALGAACVQFGLHRPNGFLYSLAVASPFVPWLDRLLPGSRFEWRRRPGKTAVAAALRPARRPEPALDPVPEGAGRAAVGIAPGMSAGAAAGAARPRFHTSFLVRSDSEGRTP